MSTNFNLPDDYDKRRAEPGDPECDRCEDTGVVDGPGGFPLACACQTMSPDPEPPRGRCDALLRGYGAIRGGRAGL